MSDTHYTICLLLCAAKLETSDILQSKKPKFRNPAIAYQGT